MFRAMVLKGVLEVVQKLENATKKRRLLFVEVNSIKTNISMAGFKYKFDDLMAPCIEALKKTWWLRNRIRN